MSSAANAAELSSSLSSRLSRTPLPLRFAASCASKACRSVLDSCGGIFSAQPAPGLSRAAWGELRRLAMPDIPVNDGQVSVLARQLEFGNL